MEAVEKFLSDVSSIVWGPFLLIPLLLGTGLFLTVRLRGIQFRTLFSAMRLAFIERHDEDAEEGDISQFQALTTALAATVGVGNIVGVATAIAIGGPGSLFWMWMTGLAGMASKYAEAFLAVRFRQTDAKGEATGGPQYYLAKGVGGPLGKWLSLAFAVFAILASLGIGNMSQGNAIVTNIEHQFGVAPWITALVIAVFVGLVLLGGIKWIGNVTAGFVPIMIVFYILGGTWILIANAGDIPAALWLILHDAFTGTAAVGGFTGSAILLVMQMGTARGIFSNESGMGSAAIAAAAAKTTHPVRQGLVSMTQTFIDTIIVVSFTGLVIITTGEWQAGKEAAPLMTSQAFTHGLPGNWGGIVVTVAVAMFALSTILGWSYYGDRCVERLFGRRAVRYYRIVFTVIVFFGAIQEVNLVWLFSDIMNGLMALPNLVGLLLLSGLIAQETRQYLKHDPKLKASKGEIEVFMEARQ